MPALSVLAEFGGFEIAMMAGAMLAAAERGMLLLIDGFIVTSALLVAAAIAPAIGDYCVFCHRSAEAGHQAQLRALHAEPLLDLGLRLGEGTGAALAWPLVRACCRFPQRNGQLRQSPGSASSSENPFMRSSANTTGRSWLPPAAPPSSSSRRAATTAHSSMATTLPQESVAKVPESSVQGASWTISARRSGTIDDMPPRRIPRLPRLAKPHRA
jgi:NaMN:DMB phosphoribosyltransferase